MGLVALAGAQTTPPLVLPSAIAYDTQGNLYIADTGGHVIRRLSVAGVVSTVAGSGVQGFAGDSGHATDAELDSPAGLAVDAAGNLYIADSHNHRVREVTAATGVITTIAGTGAAGFSGDAGPAKTAALDLPTSLALDSVGNLYVADTNNHRIRRITVATGVIATIAGDGVQGLSGDGGSATTASIDSPNGLAVDAAGNLYLSDTHNGRVREVSVATGLISTVTGATGLAMPRGLSVDAVGNLYVADSANHRIRRISAAGAMTTVAGEGTETFAGDGGAAVAASFDVPRSVAISPAGLITIADSGNQRVRQIDASTQPVIHSLSSVVGIRPATLALSGPAVSAYGSGSVTATVSSATIATGSVTFSDTVSGVPVTLAVVALDSAGSATFATSALATSSHSVVAGYAGDPTHAAAQSSPLTFTVTPLTVIATANPAAILYGQAIPTLSGVLTGVLPQDATKVTSVFTTNAGVLAPVGVYPIAAKLSGAAAGNYLLAVTTASLSIAQTPSLVLLSSSTSAASLGSPVTLNVQAVSSTSGVPAGSVSLMDGAALLGVVPISGAGVATFTTSALGLGSHALIATYTGDTNFLPSTSAVTSVTVGVGSDFTLASTDASSQTVPGGSTATFHFSVAMQGPALASPILLAVQGLPLGATASLNPTSLPPGGAVTSFTLTIQTPLAASTTVPRTPGSTNTGSGELLAAVLLPMLGLVRRFRGKVRRFAVAGIACAVTLATGCGDRVNTGNSLISAKTYTLTITATATSPAGTALQHSATVRLTVL